MPIADKRNTEAHVSAAMILAERPAARFRWTTTVDCSEGELMHTEKRNSARLAMRSKANILRGDQSIEGESENLSMDGAFVTTGRQMSVNDMVTFSMYQTPIRAIAKVVRVTDRGIGLQFEKTLLG